MFWPELVEKPGATKKFIGSGTFNSVDKLDMTNVRTGTTMTVVLKDVEISRGISSYSVAKPFSNEGQVSETGKINLATAKAARLIGCGQQVTNCGFVRVGDRYLLAQEMASGDVVRRAMPDPRNAKYTMFEMPDPNHPGKRKSVSFASGYAALPPAGREKLKKELMIATAKLEWADLLTGQLDRSGMNMMLKVDVYGDDPDNLHVLVELKGIDNDAGFTEGQTSVKTFKTTNGDVYDAQNPKDKKLLVTRMGIHSLRMPALLPLSVKRHLEALNEETFRREMQGYLGKTALDSAVARLNEMKVMIADYEANGSVVDDLSPNIQQSVTTLENIIKMNSEKQANGLKALPAHLFADNIYRLLFP